MKIKCTYPDCFKHFVSKEAMITHKKKDTDHSYCARCDVDCEDDMLYFIHQLGSPAHSESISPYYSRLHSNRSQIAAQFAAPSTKV